MARKSEKEALIERLEASRGTLGGHLAALKLKVDVPRRIGISVRKKPLLWMGGSIGVGLVVSKLLRRPRHKGKKKGITRFLLPLAFSLMKPWLKNLVVNEMQRRFTPANREPTDRLTPPQS